MRRDTFLKSLAALAATGALPAAWAQAGANLKILIPANPGGGWDTTGRALGKAMLDAKQASTVTYDNKGGAAGALGLAPFLAGARRCQPDDGDGRGDAGRADHLQVAAQPDAGTPLARLTTEYNVFVLPANSPHKTMADVVAQLKKDPGSVKWGGGSRGATEHIAAAMIAREAGVDPAKINYVAFRGGGEATAAILGGNVTVGGSGLSEFSEYIAAGTMKPIAVTSAQRLPALKDTPTLKELGLNVEIGNWRGVFGGPGITPAQRKGLIDALVATTKSASWQEALKKNDWTPALLTGDEFTKFVDNEFASLRAIMAKSGMISG